MMNQPR
jgi:hypothetical protein